MTSSKSPNRPSPSASAASGSSPLRKPKYPYPYLNSRLPEPMRRMQALLYFKKVSVSDVITFNYKSQSFSANIFSDGSIKARSSPSLSSSSHLNGKFYRSPSDYATEMAMSTLDPAQKARTPLTINGWNQCFVRGRSLNAIHAEMLREKIASVKSPNEEYHHPLRSFRPPDSINRSAQQPRPSNEADKPSKSTSLDRHQDTRRSIQPSQDEQNRQSSQVSPNEQIRRSGRASPNEQIRRSRQASPSEQVRRSNQASPNEKVRRHNQASSDEQIWRSSQISPDEQIRRSSQASPNEQTHRSSQASPNEQTLRSSQASPDEQTRRFSQASPDEQIRGDRSIGSDAKRSPISSSPKTRDSVGADGKSKNLPIERTKSLNDRDIQPRGKGSDSDSYDPLDSSKGNNHEKNGDSVKKKVTVPSPSSAGNGEQSDLITKNLKSKIATSVRGSTLVESKEHEELSPSKQTSRSDDVAFRYDEGSSRDGNENVDKSVAEEGEVEEEDGKESDNEIEETNAVQDKIKTQGTMQVSSRPSSSKKRKRSESPSTVDGASERSTRQRRESSRHSRRSDMPSLRDLPHDLDPDAMEAAAVAEQAEKEEASRRGRRTTRLAAGKIKQVDYKASNNPLMARGFSPDRDLDDEDSRSNQNFDTSGEIGRVSRRRSGGQNHLVVPLRSSKRVATMRSGQTSPLEQEDDEQGHWSGSGKDYDESDGRSDKEDGQSDEDMEPKVTDKQEDAWKDGTKPRNRGKVSENESEEEATTEKKVESSQPCTEDKPCVECTIELQMEKRQREEPVENRRDAMGWTIRQLMSIGKAAKECHSSDGLKVAQFLRSRKDWSDKDAERVHWYFVRAQKSIDRALSKVTNLVESKDDEFKMMLAFVAADIYRLQSGGLATGYPRRPFAILDHGQDEDQQRGVIVREAKKIQRDLDDARTKLDAELETRSKAEMDMDMAEVMLSEMKLALNQEEEREKELKSELEWLEQREKKTLNLVEEAKGLFSRLRGEKDGGLDESNTKEEETLCAEEGYKVEARPSTAKIEPRERTGRQNPQGSWNDDPEIVDKKAEKRARRRLEMERLRWLIAARETESESYQRLCEKERTRLFSLLDAKNRLEAEIHTLTLKPNSSSAGIAGSTAMSSGKDMSKKGEARTVVTSNSNRPATRVSKSMPSPQKGGTVSGNAVAGTKLGASSDAAIVESTGGGTAYSGGEFHASGSSNINGNLGSGGVSSSGGGGGSGGASKNGGTPWGSKNKTGKETKSNSDASKNAKRKNVGSGGGVGKVGGNESSKS